MARQFRSKIRLKVGGTMNYTTGVMAGGSVVGHFVASYTSNVTRQTLTSAIANGPTVQDVDPDSDTCEISLEVERDSVAIRNLSNYWVDGGAVEISTADAIDAKILARYGVFKMGNFGTTGRKESATETATLVGTNSLREAAWIEDQADMPEAGG